jgi:hypothetical protein
MRVLSLLVFSLPVLTGTLIVHLLWAGKNNPIELLFKLFLGIGLGLGISSLLYFAYLIVFAGSPYFLYVELALFLTALTAAYLKHKKTVYAPSPQLSVSFLQIAILVIAGFMSVSSLLALVNYSRQRGHGDWDAWMIYNRAARFIYRGQETWQDAFSRDMDLVFHADYPPLLALNIASRWDILNEETTYVPMFQGFLFSLAALGLCFGALAGLKSLGQGGLGLILLSGVTFFLSEGGRQTADVPLALYILAFIVFLFFYYREKRAVLMAFAGFTVGLAAWTKNEGLLFMFASAGVLFIFSLWKRSFRGFLLYLVGLLLPLLLLFHFKAQVAPPSEFLGGGVGTIIQHLTDTTRHQLIFGSFKGFLLHGGGWFNIGIYLILGAYFLLFQTHTRDNSDAILISLAILTTQFIGYYLSYLISPYDLEWHIAYSLNRLFVHAYPAVVFVVLSATQTPEIVFLSSLE